MEHVDAVVVGSGFGGSVAAYRLAEGGRSVVVLERGKPYPPGSFPRTPEAMGRNFWDPSNGLHGMFDVWSFRGLEGVVSSGLGGGSLIYANVLLRKDERWFVHESPLPGGGYENWPVSRADLDPHYDRVEPMLGATPYPYGDTRKTQAFEQSATRLGLDVSRPPLAVTFASRAGEEPVPGAPITDPEYGNVHGVPRSTCRLCGECDIGCNFGAKNTLDHNYLSAAAHHGADVRTRCEVRGFAPLPDGGYEVRYVVHDPQDEGSKTATQQLPLQRIRCRRLVLAAGTFGSTYLLLRNRAALPGISRALGTRFSGNGDVLGLLLGATEDPPGDGSRRLDSSYGPVITSAIRVPDEVDGGGASGRGHYIEDAGYPGFVDWLVESTQLPGSARRAVAFGLHRLRSQLASRLGRSPRSNVSQELSLLLGRAALSSSSLPLLGMGRDTPDGRMRLRHGYLDVDWTTQTSQRYIDGVRSTMRDLAHDLRGEFMDNPLWWARRVITVHPLGGAPMGRHAGEGVCDAHGEVFGFPGLHVLDGSAMPGPVGANPSLTIAALADRACDRMLAEPAARSLSRQVPSEHAPAPRVPSVPPPEVPAEATVAMPVGAGVPTSLSFTEEMKGYVGLGVDDPQTGHDQGRSLGQRLMFRLTITVADVDGFVTDPAHQGSATGYVDCDVLGGRLDVERGWFNLFTRADDPTRREMLYRLHLRDTGGNPLTLLGHKDVHDDPGLDVWTDTSTLYVRALAGHVPADGGGESRVLGAGVLRILVPDFAQQLTSFRAVGPDPLRAMEGFGRLFLGELWSVYGSRLVPQEELR
ncbi:MAG TPA: GMC family oxidoreductase [Nocardioidaceae bacterium]|nr:GMC family oxidoreductase [Nocardioidaceae bacterium]